jgi:photosystem II stability/assembly factor-like uncharacterized protein
MKRFWLQIVACSIAMFGLVGIASAAEGREILHHVHGLAFTPDGKTLMVPAHTGLAVYRDERWTIASGPAHDLMGFSMAKTAIYSSGHPAPGTPLRDPLGLVKSTDGGRSWQLLALAGEADFHLMAAGYGSGAIYVVNAERNSRMPRPGLYVTQDEGRSWKAAAGEGLTGKITSIAAHPASAALVALATTSGVHVSRDHGARFVRMPPAETVTAVSFDFDGKHIYFAGESADRLHRVALDGTQRSALALPRLTRNPVMYIAQSPIAPDTLAIATLRRDVYVSANGGETWQQIADEGKAMHAAAPDSQVARRSSGGKP